MVASSSIDGRRGARSPLRSLRHLLVVCLLCGLLVPSAAEGAKRITAAAAGGKVQVKGWATFSGAVMAAKGDKANDGEVAAKEEGAELIEAAWIYRPELEDFFVRLEVTKIPTVGTGGVGPPGSLTTIYVVQFTAKNASYQIRAHNTGNVDPEATTLPTDSAFGLFKCDENLCQKEATLKGGYGTAGEKIVVALPLKVLKDAGTNVGEGDTISNLQAYTAKGTFLGGPGPQPVYHDDITLSSKPVVIPKKSVLVTVKKRTQRADLKDGYFSASFPKSLFSRNGKTPVKTKTCLGKKCVKQTFKIKA